MHGFNMSRFLFLFNASLAIPLNFQPYPLLRKLKFEVIFSEDEEIQLSHIHERTIVWDLHQIIRFFNTNHISILSS